MFKKIDIEDLPSREKMRPRSVWVGEDRHRQNISRKVIQSYLGRSFDEFYSHICNPPPGKEKLYATVRDGVDKGWYFLDPHEMEKQVYFRPTMFYVENGIIREQEKLTYKVRKRVPKYIQVDGMFATTIDDIWYELKFQDLDVSNIYDHPYVRDVVAGWSSASYLWSFWGKPMYCVSKRQLSKKEKKRCVSSLNG